MWACCSIFYASFDSCTCRRAVLRVWKEKQSFDATYRNLLKCLARKDHKTAKKICGLEIFQESPRQQTAQETKVGGSEIHQQPAGMFVFYCHIVQLVPYIGSLRGCITSRFVLMDSLYS